jgi:hypothetical protein
MTVWIYVDTSKEIGEAAAERWFKENDPEGVAFEYHIEV